MSALTPCVNTVKLHHTAAVGILPMQSGFLIARMFSSNLFLPQPPSVLLTTTNSSFPTSDFDAI
jgi:hypothetical protein